MKAKELTIKMTRPILEAAPAGAYATDTLIQTGTETREFACGLDGYRAEVSIDEGGMPSKNSCDVTIYGLDEKTMSNFTSLVFLPPLIFDKRNRLEIYVNSTEDTSSSSSLIFIGDIRKAYADYSSFPDVGFKIEGVFGLVRDLITREDLIVEGDRNTKVEDLFKSFAEEMGYGFSNNGVSKTCPKIILQGTFREQLLQLAKATDVEIGFDYEKLCISPRDGVLINEAVPVNKGNGLIGYPSFNSNGVDFKTIFNPLIKVGGLVDINTVVPKASGKWYVNSKHTQLSTLPNGPWESEVSTYVQL
jgi:hypothetical protein